MVGKTVGLGRAALALGLATFAAALACAHNVPQDLATGADGKSKNAVAIKLEEGQGKSRGIVTYPGGDRVDWKKVELPKDRPGTLSLRLSWTTPRPGLSLGLDVFDEYGKQVASERRRNGRRSRKTEVKLAKGTYFIRVYASGRGDAGAYKLAVAYAPDPDAIGTGFPPPGTMIPDLPHLPQVPLPPIVCDDTNYKQNATVCANFCPTVVDSTWPGCGNRCNLQQPDINLKACQKVMECPEPPDTRVAKCKGKPIRTCAEGEVSTTCKQPPPPEPVVGTVNDATLKGGKTRITINRGTNQKVDRGWQGVLLDSRGKVVPGSEFVVLSVTAKECTGEVKLTTDEVRDKKARLSPP